MLNSPFCIITLCHCNIGDGSIHQIYLATLLIQARSERGTKKWDSTGLAKQKRQKIFAQNSAENAQKSTLSEWIVHCMKNWTNKHWPPEINLPRAIYPLIFCWILTFLFHTGAGKRQYEFSMAHSPFIGRTIVQKLRNTKQTTRNITYYHIVFVTHLATIPHERATWDNITIAVFNKKQAHIIWPRLIHLNYMIFLCWNLA